MCVLNCSGNEMNVSINRQLYPLPMLWQILLHIKRTLHKHLGIIHFRATTELYNFLEIYVCVKFLVPYFLQPTELQQC